MALIVKRLTEIQYVANSVASIFANPANTVSNIRSIIIYNNNSTTETVVIHNVPDNATAVGTASTANKFLTQSIDAGETVQLTFEGPGIILEDENDSIQMFTTTASQVTVQMFGGQEA